MSIRWPPEVDRPLLAAAATVWFGVLAARSTWLVLVATVVVALLVRVSGWRLLAVCLVIGLGSGVLVARRQATLVGHGVEAGRMTAVVEAATDLIEGPFGSSFVARPIGVSMGALPVAPVVVTAWDEARVTVGDRFEVTGSFRPGISRVRRASVAGRIVPIDHRRIEGPVDVHLAIANALRDRVRAVIRPGESEARGLLAGFLVGDTSELSDISIDVMRRAGLTHYVAVSGSNVALFLVLWWLLLGPLGLTRWWRTAAGLFGLAVFAALTRWEPSVIRSALAAGVLMVSRSIGIPLSSWGTLALAVSGALAISGELATDVGFQLSVLAAIGVLGGSSIWQFQPRSISSGLSASVSAQAMVSPVLISTFGAVPILSPVANLAAGPLVMMATALSGIGVLVGSGFLVSVAAACAQGVLAIAEVAAPWPQIGAVGWIGVVVCGVTLFMVARPMVLPVVALTVAVIVWPVSHRPDHLPAAVFLDVGQGDATLFLDEAFTVLIDGGPDPAVLARKLDQYGVDRIDVLIVSHVHADHIVGLESVLGRLPVGFVVADFSHHHTPAAEWLQAEVGELGVEIVTPSPGWRFGSGSIELEVLGPIRRYASPNDESVVVLVTMANQRILMTGDVETFAQGDLVVPHVDILKVPHQGAATSSLDWLSRHAGDLAVVSVGPNQFGHPSHEVLDVLAEAGAGVHRTDLDGDLVRAEP